jgi:hypothetical protein
MTRFHHHYHYFLTSFFLLAFSPTAASQDTSQANTWHNKERSIKYRPDGEDFIIENGDRRFNRALYGTNTGFRVEAGDLPEFALYMPGMGGNLQFGLSSNGKSKWLIKAQYIKTRYRAGSMLYEIKDDLLESGTLYLTVLATADAEGIMIKAESKNVTQPTFLVVAFGGATGKRFSRDGDIGADPESSFYLKPEYCRDNLYSLNENNFTLHYGSGKELSEADLYEINHVHGKESSDLAKQKKLTGIFPPKTELRIANPFQQSSPLAFFDSGRSLTPALVGKLSIKSNDEIYFFIQNPSADAAVTPYENISGLFLKAERAREKLAGRVKLITPDPYLNTLGSTLSVAADAIWEDPSYLHGAVAWRMRLNAWRGAYVADPLGWHDRAKKHFSSYALSQITNPETGPLAPDTALHFARQTEKIGTAMFSSGYICRNPGGDIRAHHYDMNLVFIDQLLNHFNWTGDLDYVKEMWPVIKLHLAWEKRNFDSDGDGLYDAYCCIWASDALEYSNGGVTHSSAYNYRAFAAAAQLAELIGEDPKPYHTEAEKIRQAIQKNLWMPQQGWYAEYKDFLGKKLVHPSAGIWTIYHVIDSHVPDPFQAYQSLRYVDTQIPHIPMHIKGFPKGDHFTLSTTTWLPYTWSINNVALAETLHTSLAYWQGGRADEAFKLWRSALLESMYASASPGGFEQLSFYDAIRGELYRDFADPIGMVGRTLVEGLFGIAPNALKDTLLIRPGFPEEWNNASLSIPDLKFDFKRSGTQDVYVLTPSFPKKMNLTLQLKARAESVRSVLVNGKKTKWKTIPQAIESPMIQLSAGVESTYKVEVNWSGGKPDKPTFSATQFTGEKFKVSFNQATVVDFYDPQEVLEKRHSNKNLFQRYVSGQQGNKTVFAKVRQGELEWWTPLTFSIRNPVEILSESTQGGRVQEFTLRNNGAITHGKLIVNPGKKIYTADVTLEAYASKKITIPENYLITGSNVVRFEYANGKTIERILTNWEVKAPEKKSWKMVDLNNIFNDDIKHIFKNKYLSPRSSSPTLQIPWQGIGNWCYPLIDPQIDDSGLRRLAAETEEIKLAQGIPFRTPGTPGKNIVFTSQWDNYPDSVVIPVNGLASHIYFLMAGSTNPMQSRFVNGEVSVQYMDNSEDRLELKNPETWWPIEQDYFTDGFAFNIDQPKPIRVHLKTGLITRSFSDYKSIKGFTNTAIEGGAAIVLDLPLNPSKPLKSIKVKAIANEVIIGLMSATLMRP